MKYIYFIFIVVSFYRHFFLFREKSHSLIIVGILYVCREERRQTEVGEQQLVVSPPCYFYFERTERKESAGGYLSVRVQLHTDQLQTLPAENLMCSNKHFEKKLLPLLVLRIWILDLFLT